LKSLSINPCLLGTLVRAALLACTLAALAQPIAAQSTAAQSTAAQSTAAQPTGAQPTGAQPAGAQPTTIQPAVPQPPAARQRNVIVFIADGLRNGSVNSTDAPTLLSIRQQGVNFTNSHSLYPTLTTPNASAIATGHYLGDTGDFSNTEYVGFPVFNTGNFGKKPGSPVPFLENDPILGDLDDHFARGNFLTEDSLLSLARAKGFNTAAIGKLGPVAIQDVSQLDPRDKQYQVPKTIILDDLTGTPDGVPIPPAMQAALAAANLTPVPTKRNQPAGDVTKAGTLDSNAAQQTWFVDATTHAVLPEFARSKDPFVLVYWSRDPDGSQHNHGDSLNSLRPGINGPTSRAGVRNADDNLRQILDYLRSNPALLAATDVFVTSDHGFATISKHEIGQGGATRSHSTTFKYLTPDGAPDVVEGWLPPGFVAIDLAHFLGLPLYDPDNPLMVDGAAHYQRVDPSAPATKSTPQHPANGNALIGGSGLVQDGTDAQVIIAANGGSDLIYLTPADRGPSDSERRPIGAERRKLARRIVGFLAAQDYVGGLFVDSRYGKIPGALPLSTIALEGAAQMPRPSIVVSFKTFLTDPTDLQSTAQIADTVLQEGQGMHGSLDRSNTFNNMAAIGPDFKQGFVSRAPMSNADIVPTLAHILKITLPGKSRLQGRVLKEALVGGPDEVRSRRAVLRSEVTPSGKTTLLHMQEAEGRQYFDRACLADQHERSCGEVPGPRP
jgi:Type I phosphodiesterase / nucleotide pyrophosphatase